MGRGGVYASRGRAAAGTGRAVARNNTPAHGRLTCCGGDDARPIDRLAAGTAGPLANPAATEQANVSIDERGIEAAAATAMGEGCAGPDPLKQHELKVNRPFMFVIRDLATGAFLFVGRVVDPGALP